MAGFSLDYWQQQADAARQVAEIMEDPLGKRAMLDVAATCEDLASNPRLARVARIWPGPAERSDAPVLRRPGAR
jgi:hypothetical protein